MSLLDALTSIDTAANEAAAQHAVSDAAIASFRDRSDATQPSAGFVVPVAAATKTPRGYQAAAVETVLTHRRAVLGFAPGMGKTLTAMLVIAAAVAEGKRALVICPPSLRIGTWGREIAAEFPHLNVVQVTGQTAAALPEDADVAIVGDSVVAHRAEDLLAWAPQALVIDEAQRMKNRTAKRALAARDLADSVNAVADGIVLLLTGTLAVNRPDEVYMPVRIAGEIPARRISGGSSYKNFQSTWCTTESIFVGGRRVNVTTGCKDAAGLHESLRRNLYISVDRSTVIDDLPEKNVVRVGLSLSSNDLRTYNRLESEFLRWVQEMHGDEAMMRAAKAEAVVKMMKLWQEAGRAKVNETVDYVLNLIEQGEQVVVMGWHSAPIAALHSALAARKVTCEDGTQRHVEVAEVIGGMNAQQKADAVDDFQSGAADVLIGNITAAGTGLDLDAACHLVFFQLPWSPGDFVQASDRIYRLTQKRNCTIHILNALGTVDERMDMVLAAKADVVDVINAGRTGITMSESSVQDEVLGSYGW